MKQDISFVNNKKPDKCRMDVGNDYCVIRIDYHSVNILMASNSLCGITMKSKEFMTKSSFDNSYCFDNIVDNDYYMHLFHFPKQCNKVTKYNKRVLQSIYKRFFGI